MLLHLSNSKCTLRNFDQEKTTTFLCISDGVVSNYIVSRKYKPISEVNKRSVALRLQCIAYSTSLLEWGMLDHYHAWSGHCLQLLPRANFGGQCVFCWGLRGGKIASWKPANPLTDSSGGDLETDRSILGLMPQISLGVGLSLARFLYYVLMPLISKTPVGIM